MKDIEYLDSIEANHRAELAKAHDKYLALTKKHDDLQRRHNELKEENEELRMDVDHLTDYKYSRNQP